MDDEYNVLLIDCCLSYSSLGRSKNFDNSEQFVNELNLNFLFEEIYENGRRFDIIALSHLNSNINPCTKVRKLLCLVKPPPASSAIFPNTYLAKYMFSESFLIKERIKKKKGKRRHKIVKGNISTMKSTESL